MCNSCRFFSQPFFYHSLDWSSLSFSSRISDAGESPVSRSRLRSTCDVALAKVGRSRAINGNRELFLEDSLPDFEAPLGPRNEAFSRPRKGRGKTLLHQKEREKISKKENSQTLPPSVSFVDETRQPRAIDNPDEEGGDKSLLFVNSSRFLFCSRPPPPPSPFSNFSPHPPPPPPFLFLALVPRFLSRMQTRTDTHENRRRKESLNMVPQHDAPAPKHDAPSQQNSMIEFPLQEFDGNCCQCCGSPCTCCPGWGVCCLTLFGFTSCLFG